MHGIETWVMKKKDKRACKPTEEHAKVDFDVLIERGTEITNSGNGQAKRKTC